MASNINPMTTNRPLTLDAFLKKHAYNKDDPTHNEITHTRIGDKKQIFGGSYSIPQDEMQQFYELYAKHVFEQRRPEYLTEKQNSDGGCVLVDFDFRYNVSVKKRQHTEGHVIDIIDLYTRKIKDILQLGDQPFPIYIFEKPNVNVIESENLTKDGIHMIIGLNMTHQQQLFLRHEVLKEIGDVLMNLPLLNTWESVLDEGISAGYTNWQLYGSRKPHNQSYRLTMHYEATFDADDGEFEINKINQADYHSAKILPMLSAQYSKHVSYPLTGTATQNFKEWQQTAGAGGGMATGNRRKRTTKKGGGLNIVNEAEVVDFNKITNMGQLNKAIEAMLVNVSALDYFIKESHEFVMILPSTYYEKGSYDKWIRVGWALKNTHHALFLTWIKMSSQAEQFDFRDIGYFHDMWKKFEYKKDGLTYKSILYWAKNDADSTQYKKIRQETVDYFIEESLKGSTEFDLANVLLQLYKDRFICVSIKPPMWYEFKNHRWVEIDSGYTLRLAISTEVNKIYMEKILEAVNASCSMDEDDPNKAKVEQRAHTLTAIATMLKRTRPKNDIMKEAAELFYDKQFLEMQDADNSLMCFKNGVFDFRENVFRDGKPEDYITMSTKLEYVPIERVDKKHLAEVEDFIKQLFPVPELREYMWNHLSSTLIGTNENQTFNIYTGSGANGKSKLVELMSKILGDYKGTVPITLITQKRTSIGSTSSEIVQLRGKRYAVMQEPSKGDKINEGIMKEITGGDPIQGRALFKETITFMPQFKLVVCTNTLFDIKDTGDGTWRRIRVCDFMSKFRDNPVQGDQDEPHQYPIDKKIEIKFETWKIPFMSKLVELAKGNKGIVKDCDIVLCKSNAYRDDQDYLSEFIKEKVEVREGGKIKKTELNETFKQWYTLQYDPKVPKAKDLYDLMDKKYGKFTLNKCWKNVAVVYDVEEEEELEA